ncbi:hypothetical protein AAVH_20808 [Aphelenchoides avenae]|nr:hypothetical protein AAVH_20808 [Aphelenchus avenae]
MLRFIAATRKNTSEVLIWLDRFSLDAVQFTCTLFKAIVDVYLPMAPKRVLRSVTYGRCTATLVAKCLRDKIEKTLRGESADVFRRMFALCSGCAIEYFDLDMPAWTPTILAIFADNLPSIPVRKAQLQCPFVLGNALIDMMNGLESVHIRRHAEAINDDTMRVCAKSGIASLSVWNGCGVTDEALLDFCFSNTQTNGDAADRTLFMDFPGNTTGKTCLSASFIDKLVKKCIDQLPKPLPSVTLGCVVDTTAYDGMAKTHANRSRNCTHFQFEASGEKFEIVVRKHEYGPSDLIVRKGHVDIEECTPRRYFCEWEGEHIYI